MIRYLSTRGGIAPVSFEEAVLQGFAADGGLFVPQYIPTVTSAELGEMSHLTYTELAVRLLKKFIGPAIIPENDLRMLLAASFQNFEAPETIPIVSLAKRDIFIMELFHGPTLSFKDIAMGFLVNTMDYFLGKRKERLSVILATTGDTGPAAAFACAGKKTIDCWPLYPEGMISEEQERQMTTIEASNVHPIAVKNCLNGGDDLDIVVANVFSDAKQKQELKLSSVNSINWCRVLVQCVHYFHAYFQVAEKIGEEVVFSVPTGAFGNLFAGYLARAMGLPVKSFICATNRNKTLHRLFSEGIFANNKLQRTLSSAIDIVIPYNFWRFLYFNSGCNADGIKKCMAEFRRRGVIQFESEVWRSMRNGFLSTAISDEETLHTIRSIYADCGAYLLDPHGAVAVTGADKCRSQIGQGSKVICLATAHPAKFPAVIRQAFGQEEDLPAAGVHDSLNRVKTRSQHRRIYDYTILERSLINDLKNGLTTPL